MVIDDGYELHSDVEGYELVLQIGDWDYSWSEMRVYKKDGRFFYITDAGCSCNDWDDYKKSEADMIELPNLEAGKNAVKGFVGYGDFSTQINVYLDHVEKLRGLGLR